MRWIADRRLRDALKALHGTFGARLDALRDAGEAARDGQRSQTATLSPEQETLSRAVAYALDELRPHLLKPLCESVPGIYSHVATGHSFLYAMNALGGRPLDPGDRGYAFENLARILEGAVRLVERGATIADEEERADVDAAHLIEDLFAEPADLYWVDHVMELTGLNIERVMAACARLQEMGNIEVGKDTRGFATVALTPRAYAERRAAVRAVERQSPTFRRLRDERDEPRVPDGRASGAPRSTPVAPQTVLFVAANARDQARLALDAEARSIQEAVNRVRHRFVLSTRWSISGQDLLSALRTERPAILHISGHANAQGLQLVRSDGSALSVTAEALAAAIDAAGRSVRAVVLSVCDGGAFMSALRARVDCVIGFVDTVHDEAAREFSTGFYGALVDGESVASAFENARAGMKLAGLLNEAAALQCLARDGVDLSRLFPSARDT